MEVVPADAEHLEIIKSTFDRSRNRRAEYHVDYLAQPEIADFHRDRLCKTLRQSHTPPFQLVFHEHQLMGICSTQHSEWHSEHFKLPYYKIQPFYCFVENDALMAPFTKAWAASLPRKPGALFTLRIEGHQSALGYALQQVQARHVGVSVRMNLPVDKIIVDIISSNQYDSLKIRDFKSPDLEAVQSIGMNNHNHSHFFNEVRFDPADVHAIFGKWLDKCVNGVANKILIAESGGTPVGFATLLTSDAMLPVVGKRIGVIDFIVADQSLQGAGIGTALLKTALAWFAERVDLVELRTMSENLRAIRFYQKHGFRILSSDHHYHLWNDDRVD